MDTQAVRQPETAVRQKAQESPAPVRPATLTALLQTRSSGYSREFLRESVLAWAARKWPELFVGRNVYEPAFQSHSGRSQIQVTSACDGNHAWSFKGIRPDVTGARYWETRVLVLGNEGHDLLGVSTGYLGDVDPKATVAQPAFLNGLIEHLPFEDGGYPVCTVPRQVFDERAFVNLHDHLLSQRRTLPILIVGAGSSSSESRDWEEPHRINARSIAQQLCGLAHVVCVGPLILGLLEARLGSDMAVRSGEARLYLPGPGNTEREQRRRSAQALPDTTHFAAGDVGAAARAAVYAWSVSASRRTDFNSLWATAVAA
jgi:hypothetical protein